MTLALKKVKGKKGNDYYHLVDTHWVKGKAVTKYVAYVGKSPKARVPLQPEQLLPYVSRLLRKDVTDDDIRKTLHLMGVTTDVWPISKILIENDRKVMELSLRFK